MSENGDKLPREFGKYHLIERIATGGMAELYRAKLYGAGGFEKDLAIKKVLPQLADDESFTKMFMDEAMITVTLSHGNIVSVLDFGVHEGEYYLVMEFVDGVDLQSLVRKSAELGEPVPASIASYIALEVCRGLDYAHRKVGPDGRPLEIVHRDISPQNILISFEGEVKIVDFGIARAASRITSTQAGVVKGKLAYMSPEQISGQQVDRRADVYSAGVSLYEMLTCRRPFEGNTPSETLAAITRGTYEKPHKLNRKVDKRLSAVVRKAIERNPKKRYQTAGEMAADLSSYLHKAGIYPDATTLAAFIPQRLPDAKPRTIQPTPIRAIRRKTERPATVNTGVMGTPAAGVPQQPATAAPGEAVSFDMLGLDTTAVEPADSRRATDPQYPATVQATAEAAAHQDAPAELLAAKTEIRGQALEQPSDGQQQPPGDQARDELLAAKTMLLKEQPADEQPPPAELTPSAEPADDNIAERWLQGGQETAATPASPSDTGAIRAAAFSRKAPLRAIVAIAAVAVIAVLAVIFWPSERVTPPSPTPTTAPPPGKKPRPIATVQPEQTESRPEKAPADFQQQKETPPPPAPKKPAAAPSRPAQTASPPAKTAAVEKPALPRTKPSTARKITKPGKPRKKAAAASKLPATTGKPRPMGKLRINSEPFSVVYLGRKKIGPTPQMDLELPAGSHTLTLRNDALGIKRRVRVRIQPHKVHTVFVDLNNPSRK